VNRLLALAILPLISIAPSQAADLKPLDLPAGRLSDAVAALAAQTGASVGVTDASVWSMRVAAVQGRMDAAEALRRLLRGSRAGFVSLGANSFRIYPMPAMSARRTAPIAAAPAFEGEDSTIVVTASKRETRLRDFAGSVSMLEGADLGFGGEQGTESILARVASLSSTHLGAGRNKLFIRGIADSSFTGPTQATVGQYWGDMRLTYNAPDPDLRLYDIQSVEILEGPQGTLYGAGSLGGIIRVTRNPPDPGRTEASVSGGLSATQHGDPSGDIGGMVNLPLVSDRIALRAVGYGISEGGYIDDVWRGRKDINRTRIAGGRATVRLDPGDDWTVDVGGIFQNNHGRDSQYADRNLGGLKRASRTPGGFDADYALGELVIAKNWDSLSFMSSTGYARQRLDERYDASPPAGPDRRFSQRNLTNMLASESRLWRPMRRGFGWVLGVSHTRNKTNIDRSFGAAPVPGVTNRVKESTVFAEASVEPLRGLIATGGARYTRSRLTGGAEDPTPVGADINPRLAALIAQARAEIIAGRTEKRFLPSASISTTPIAALTVYARYQQGFRPGGLAIESGYVRRFRNDRVRTMETGLRLGKRGRDIFDLSLSLSHTRWTNIQADFIDASGLPSTDNIGDGRIYSLSAELGLRPAKGLTLDIATTFNDSKVVDPSANLLAALDAPPVNNETGARTGGQSRIPNVARFTTRIGADYRVALDEALELRISGWARYVGRSRLGIGPILGDLQGDYFESSLTARVGRPDMGVSLGVTNLTDTIGNRFALGTPFSGIGAGQITPLRPRTIRIGFDRSF
jgi:outer membrane receptor protein involved in Fe transport